RVQAAKGFAFGGGIDGITSEARLTTSESGLLTVAPSYARSHAFVEMDSRTSTDYSRGGGLYRIEFSDYRQTNGRANSFRRVDAEAQRFIPILREHWVVALRALASTTDSASGQSVPFSFLPALGGTHALRGYPSWRFRDHNRLLFSGEYRWTAGSFVDMA